MTDQDGRIVLAGRAVTWTEPLAHSEGAGQSTTADGKVPPGR